MSQYMPLVNPQIFGTVTVDAGYQKTASLTALGVVNVGRTGNEIDLVRSTIQPLSVVVDGDSIASQIFTALPAASSRVAGGTINVASHVGDTIATTIAKYTSVVHPLAPAAGVDGEYLVMSGTNSLDAGETAASCYSQLQTLLALARADGFRTILCTITPRTDFSGSKETERIALNVLIRSNRALYDNLAELDVVLPDASSGYYSGGLHLSASGAARACQYIAPIFGESPIASSGKASDLTGTIGVMQGGTGADLSATKGYLTQATKGSTVTTLTVIPVADVTGAAGTGIVNTFTKDQTFAAITASYIQSNGDFIGLGSLVVKSGDVVAKNVYTSGFVQADGKLYGTSLDINGKGAVTSGGNAGFVSLDVNSKASITSGGAITGVSVTLSDSISAGAGNFTVDIDGVVNAASISAGGFGPITTVSLDILGAPASIDKTGALTVVSIASDSGAVVSDGAGKLSVISLDVNGGGATINTAGDFKGNDVTAAGVVTAPSASIGSNTLFVDSAGTSFGSTPGATTDAIGNMQVGLSGCAFAINGVDAVGVPNGVFPGISDANVKSGLLIVTGYVSATVNGTAVKLLVG